MDSKIEKWAKVLVDYSCRVQKGDWVYLVTNCIEAKPLYDAVRREILRKGAHVSDHFGYDPCGGSRTGIEHDYLFLKEATEEQLSYFPKFKMAELKAMRALIIIEGIPNPQEMQGVPSRRYPRRMKVLDPLVKERMKKRWILTAYPTDAHAQNAGMSLDELWEFTFSALFLDKEDPIAELQKIFENQAKLIEIFKEAQQIKIQGRMSNLVLSTIGRKWINEVGHLNLPDGEFFTAPIENSVQGEIYFGDFPIICGGKEVSGIKLKFQSGKVVEAFAEKGNEYLQAVLDTDRGASRLGEIGIGTNFGIKKPTKLILFDEKIGGTIHLALGDGFAEMGTGSKNKSAIHQDIIKPLKIFDPNDPDQAELLILKEGQWLRLAKRRETLVFEKV